MSYKDLNKETVKDYLKECTDYFPADANLSVYEIGEGEEDGDGFINFLYRVWDENGKSVIVKQAKTYYKAFGEGAGPFVVDRNALEADILRIKGAVTPEYIPKIYHVDLENHIYLCEDCSHLKILRFELMKGKKFPHFPEMIGEFMAQTNFYTSEYYLDPVVHKELQVKFMNPQMRLVFEVGLFLKDEHVIEGHDPHEDKTADAKRLAMGDAPWEKEAFRIEMLKLRDAHMKCTDCLVHGDLHTSNIMIDDREVKVIDMEYTFMGNAASDMGYLMGSVLYEYIRWFYVEDFTEEERLDLSATALGYMRDLVKTYLAVYTACWKKDAKKTYRQYDGFRESILKNWFHEMCGFTGCQVLSRVGGLVPLPDFDSIPDREKRNEACQLSLFIAEYLVMNREKIETIDDMMDAIIKLTGRFQKMMRVLGE